MNTSGAFPQAPDESVLRAAAAEAVSRRPDRQLAALQIDKSQAEQRLAKAARWEDIGIGAGITRQREQGMYNTMVGMVVAVPLPLWNRNQGRIAETQAAQQRATAGVEALDLTIATEIREAQARVTGLASVLTRTRGPALDLARQTTKLIEETYASGTASFLTVFESRKQRLAIEQAAIDTEEQLAAAITDWEMRTAHFPAAVRAALASEGRRAPKAAAAKTVVKPAKRLRADLNLNPPPPTHDQTHLTPPRPRDPRRNRALRLRDERETASLRRRRLLSLTLPHRDEAT